MPPYLCLLRRNFCAAEGVLFGYSGAILERLRNPFIDYSSAKYACLALSVLRDVITSFSSKNSHKAPLKPLGHLRLRELRRQPLQNVPQKAPQSPALKPPSTARTAGRSDRAERRFRRQPFILLSFSSSKKPRKAQKTLSYQRFQHIVHTVFNTSGTNALRSLSQAKAGTHSPLLKKSHTAAHTPKRGHSLFGHSVVLCCQRNRHRKNQPEKVDARQWRVSAFPGTATPLGCGNLFFWYSVVIFAPLLV